MAIKPKINVNAQAKAAISNQGTGAQGKAVRANLRKGLKSSLNAQADEAAETIYIPSPGARDRNQIQF